MRRPYPEPAEGHGITEATIQNILGQSLKGNVFRGSMVVKLRKVGLPIPAANAVGFDTTNPAVGVGQ